jgi:hypothetical protein
MLSVNPIAGAGSQLSVAVAVPVVPGADDWSHSIVVFAGQLMTGATESVTVMVWSAFAELPQLSVAVQLRVI